MFRAGLYARVSTNDQQTLWRGRTGRCGSMPPDAGAYLLVTPLLLYDAIHPLPARAVADGVGAFRPHVVGKLVRKLPLPFRRVGGNQIAAQLLGICLRPSPTVNSWNA